MSKTRKAFNRYQYTQSSKSERRKIFFLSTNLYYCAKVAGDHVEGFTTSISIISAVLNLDLFAK